MGAAVVAVAPNKPGAAMTELLDDVGMVLGLVKVALVVLVVLVVAGALNGPGAKGVLEGSPNAAVDVGAGMAGMAGMAGKEEMVEEVAGTPAVPNAGAAENCDIAAPVVGIDDVV